MTKINIDKIIKELPKDYSKHATRELSVLTSSIFAETYNNTLYKKFRADFNSTLWIVRENLTIFYRSESEHINFERIVGEKCLESNLQFTKMLADKLVKYTDWINDFISRNKTLEDFLENRKEFIDNYRVFFAYHQAVYWSGDYAAKNSKSKTTFNKIAVLDKAYKYNEMVVPNVEKYLSKLKIDIFLHDELNSKIRSRKRERFIGILFLDKKRIILNIKESKILENLIKKRNKLRNKNARELKGVAVSKGKYRGKVKLIKNLYRLNQVRKGDVLVTPMTRPQFNTYIKKAGAIITDDGGLLCHASILAREFNIPCVVGTKIATQVLKNGDIVKVDAEKGRVRVVYR